MKYNFAVIGLGRVGGSLLELLIQAGHSPCWVVTSGQAAEDVRVYPEIPADPGDAQVVLLAVPDSAIRETSGLIAARWKDSCKGRIFFHLSGLLTSDILSDLEKRGAETGSLHPLQSIMDRKLAGQAMKEAFFFFEGSLKARDAAEHLVSSLGSRFVMLSKQDKVAYHAAAVIASNYVVAVTSQASDIMDSVGLKPEYLIPLIRSTVSNIGEHGRSALTGPVLRGDWETVRAHSDLLRRDFPDILPAYLALGRYAAGLSSRTWPVELNKKDKVLDRETLKERVDSMKKRGMKVVFTNGCFDIIHEGHVSYLEEARGLGDVLVVGLNSDTSVRRLKGEDRPLNSGSSRAAVLAALQSVDHVCIFEEDTPYELIAALKPHVLVKGGDWKPDTIVGADIVKACGGEVLSLAFKTGHSTTGIIEKIRKL